MAIRTRVIDSAGSAMVGIAIAGQLLFQALMDSRPNILVVLVVALFLLLPGIAAAKALAAGFGLAAERKPELTTGQVAAIAGACMGLFAVAVGVLTYGMYVLDWSNNFSNPNHWMAAIPLVLLLLPGVLAVAFAISAEPRPALRLTTSRVIAMVGACVCAFAGVSAVVIYSTVLGWPKLYHFLFAGATLLLLVLLGVLRPPRLTGWWRLVIWLVVYVFSMSSGPWPSTPPGWSRQGEASAALGLAAALWLVGIASAVEARRTYGRLSFHTAAARR